jgi:thioredoxin 2
MLNGRSPESSSKYLKGLFGKKLCVIFQPCLKKKIEYGMSEKVQVSCLGCGTTNYFPLDAQGKSVVCGRCKRPLPVPGMILEPLPGMTHELFRNSAIPILVEFYSQGCAHCGRMEPILAGVAQRRRGELMVIKMSLDRHPEMGASFGIMGVPTFLVIQKGNERGRMSGALPEADFDLWLAKLL